KCVVAPRVQRRLERTKVEKADAPDLALLLREGSERRCKSTCPKRHDQFPAIIHSLPFVCTRLPSRATGNRLAGLKLKVGYLSLADEAREPRIAGRRHLATAQLGARKRSAVRKPLCRLMRRSKRSD